MSARNALIACAALVAMAPVAGCNSSNGPAPASGSTSTSAAGNRTYGEFAARDGERKTFAVTEGKARSTRTLTVTAVRRHGDDTLATVLEQRRGVESRTLTYTVHPDGSIQDPAVVLRFRSGDTLTLDGPLIPGSSALQTGRQSTEHLHARLTRSSGVVSGSETVTVRGRGFTTVSVPAGRFHTLAVAIDVVVLVGPARVTIDLVDQVSRADGTVAETEHLSASGAAAVTVTEVLTKLVSGATASA